MQVLKLSESDKIQISIWGYFRRSFYIIVLTLYSFLYSCVDRYHLENEIKLEPKIVIDALITNKENSQCIVISLTTSPEFLRYTPLSGCFVKITDDKGNIFEFNEKSSKKGYYYGTIPQEYFLTNSTFLLEFETPEGEKYVSTTEKLYPCPEVGLVYSEIEYRPTREPNITEDGIQFYTDFMGSESVGNYFRIELTETWEYHSTFPITSYIDTNNVFHDLPIDYSRYTCYNTKKIDEIFLIKTNDLKLNQYDRFPLQFVNDHSQRLMYRYSLLVEQFSLSESAYKYWSFLKENYDNDGMFGIQPLNALSNIKNINKPNEEILGYFSVSQVKSKRFFVNAILDFFYSEVVPCSVTVPVGFLPPKRPLYFASEFDPKTQRNKSGYANSECFDCTLKGGTTIIPDFWKNTK